jgi:hypothetical protein
MIISLLRRLFARKPRELTPLEKEVFIKDYLMGEPFPSQSEIVKLLRRKGHCGSSAFRKINHELPDQVPSRELDKVLKHEADYWIVGSCYTDADESATRIHMNTELGKHGLKPTNVRLSRFMDHIIAYVGV